MKMFDENTTCLYLCCIAMRWLAIRIDTLAGDTGTQQNMSADIVAKYYYFGLHPPSELLKPLCFGSWFYFHLQMNKL
jgi:hypothetical protein